MGREIERKFLVDRHLWQEVASETDHADLAQGYLLAARNRSVRVRVTDGGASLTIKGATEGYSRADFENDIPLDNAQSLLELCVGYSIEQRRYRLEENVNSWMVDEFTGANSGPVVAEIELDSEDQTFSRPAWLSEEVSDDPAYFNANLSRMPFSTWESDS